MQAHEPLIALFQFTGQSLVPAKLDLSKPVLVCMSGVNTITDERAQEFAETAQELLGGAEAMAHRAQIYTVRYCHPELLKGSERIAQLIDGFCKDGTGSDAHEIAGSLAGDFLHTQLKPLLPQASADREQAYRDTARMLGNLNFFNYSLGTITLQHIHHQIEPLLREKGWNAQEAAQLMQQVKAVTVGEYTERVYNQDPWHFAGVHMISGGDRQLDTLIVDRTISKDLVARVQPPGSRRLYVEGKLPNSGFILKAPMEPNEPADLRLQTDRTGHHVKSYVGVRFSDDSNGMMARTIIQSALRNAILASEQGRRIEDPKELLKPAQLAPQAEEPSTPYLGYAKGYDYENRIERVLAPAVTARA